MVGPMTNAIISAFQRMNRKINGVRWHDLRSTEPVSGIFGLDRGTPIDRYYIEQFLNENRALIHGDVLEISENAYSKKFGSDVKNFEILHFTGDNPQATIVGDLTDISTLPEQRVDCFICTQTYNFIYNFPAAIRGTRHLLKNGGVVLATMGGISQISEYDMEKWGDYWRFTTKSAYKMFSDVFGESNVKVDFYGNVLSSIAFIEGISSEELTRKELDYKDARYQLVITVRAFR